MNEKLFFGSTTNGSCYGYSALSWKVFSVFDGKEKFNFGQYYATIVQIQSNEGFMNFK